MVPEFNGVNLAILAIEIIFPGFGKPGSFCTVMQVTETELLLHNIPDFGYFLVTFFFIAYKNFSANLSQVRTLSLIVTFNRPHRLNGYANHPLSRVESSVPPKRRRARAGPYD